MYLINFKDIVFTTLNKLLYFIGGICIGILVVLLIYLIVTIISNKLKNRKTKKIVIETSKNDLNNIIEILADLNNRFDNLEMNTIYLSNYGVDFDIVFGLSGQDDTINVDLFLTEINQ